MRGMYCGKATSSSAPLLPCTAVLPSPPPSLPPHLVDGQQGHIRHAGGVVGDIEVQHLLQHEVVWAQISTGDHGGKQSTAGEGGGYGIRLTQEIMVGNRALQGRGEGEVG